MFLIQFWQSCLSLLWLANIADEEFSAFCFKCLTATVAAVMPTDDFRPDIAAHLVSSSDQMSALARGLVSGRNLHLS